MTWFRRAFGAYVRYRIRGGLDGMHVRGLPEVLRLLERGPVVFASNHVCWWDTMALFPLDDALGAGGRVWMDAANLKKFPFFLSLGALALDDSGPAALRRSVREAAGWLTGPGRYLWVFPQGHYVPSWVRPLGLRPGASFVARHAKTTLVPVGLTYGFRQGPAPALVVTLGAPVGFDDLEGGIEAALSANDAFLLRGDPAYSPLLGGVASGTEHSLAARALGLLVNRG